MTPLDAIQAMLAFISSLFYRLFLNVLSAGPIPKHICFVMDGNRRHARSRGKRAFEGHKDGFHALYRLLDVCLGLHIRCVSVFAFSIENFKRPEDEVQALMSLAKEKLVEMSRKGDLLDRYDVRLNIVGRRELLPPDVQAVAVRVEEMTRHHKRAILNICMPYTSRDEMTRSVQKCAKNCQSGVLGPDDITEDEIDKCLETCQKESPPLDVFVRTSGTFRLSDYMLWQTSEGVPMHFTDTYWPDFGYRDFIPILLAYQKWRWLSS